MSDKSSMPRTHG